MAMMNANDNLSARVSHWRVALAASDTGPLVIAAEVVRFSNEWNVYSDEAGGGSCTSWLRKTLGNGRGLAYFEVRDRAVKKLGESVRRTLHHNVAVWIVNNAPEPTWKACVEALTFSRKKNGGNALTMQQARLVLRPILGIQVKPRGVTCARCARLEELLRENGVELK